MDRRVHASRRGQDALNQSNGRSHAVLLPNQSGEFHGSSGQLGVRVLGHTHDLTFERNKIADTGTGLQTTAIFVGKGSTSPKLESNQLTGAIVHEAEHVHA